VGAPAAAAFRSSGTIGEEEVVMKRIVVGVDESELSMHAVGWAAGAAAASGAELVLVHAFRPTQSELPPGRLDALQARRAAALERRCAPLLRDVPHRFDVVTGDPRVVLPGGVEAHDADVLVVGRAGAGSAGPGFLHVGSVVEHLAHRVDRPFVVVPPGVRSPVRRVVVAVDGSPGSRRAARWVADLVAGTDAEVAAVAVEEPAKPICTAPDSATWHHLAGEIVSEEWAAPLGRLGDRFSVVLSQALPVTRTILRVTEEEAADLVVVGARGVGGFSGLRIGGVALSVLHRTGTTTTVAVVPEPRTLQEGAR
jgi:nucleotide-binding universal stress UspA family protein